MAIVHSYVKLPEGKFLGMISPDVTGIQTSVLLEPTRVTRVMLMKKIYFWDGFFSHQMGDSEQLHRGHPLCVLRFYSLIQKLSTT